MQKVAQPNRMQQYKNAGRCSSAYRDQLRKKCLDRLRSDRLDRHNDRRNLKDIVASIVKETVTFHMGNEPLEQLCQWLERDVEDEFREEFEAIEEAFNAAADAHLAEMSEPTAFCPQCKLHPLTVNHSGCLCQACRFAYRFPPSCSPSVEQLGDLLLAAFGAHADTGCDNMPDPVIEGTALGLLCSRCGQSAVLMQ